MRLISCHIENFGRLSDLDISFEPGLNTIMHENGWGKSTLAIFMRTMFFGFNNDAKKNKILNERKHYLPWQDGVYGGSLVFEAGGKEYRIERKFGKTKSKDIFSIFDNRTNQPSRDYSKNIGEELFGIDLNSFSRTIYTGQQDCVTSVTPEIGAMIGNVSDDTADMGNYGKVQEDLKKEMNRLTPNRKTGLIKQLETDTAGLRERACRKNLYLREADEADSRIRELEDRRNSALEEQKKISGELKKLSAIKDALAENEKYRNLKKEEQEAAEKLEAARKGFPEESLEKLDSYGAEALAAEAGRMNEKWRTAEKTLYALDGKRRQAGLIKQAGENAEPKRSKKMTGLLALLIVICLAFAEIGILLIVGGSRGAGAGLIAAAAAAFIAWAVVRTRSSGRAGREASRASAEYEAVMEKIQAEEDSAGSVKKEVSDFLAGFGAVPDDEDFYRDLESVKDRLTETGRLEKELEARRSEVREYERIHDTGMVPGDADAADASDGGVSMGELTAGYDRIQDDINGMEEDIRTAMADMESAEKSLENAEEAEALLAENTELMEKLRHRYDIIEKTSSYLERAKAGFTGRYMDPVKAAFDKYYDMMADGDDREYELDADLNISVREQGALRDTDLLSEGYRDLVGLCRRMAMTDAMYGKEKPFLIFDDPFVNLDDGKLEGALSFLEKIAADYQVIYFTCSRSRVPGKK